MEEIKMEVKLTDAYRTLYPEGKETTFYNKPFKIGTRLDRFYIVKDLIDRLKQAQHIAIMGCDHKAIPVGLRF